MFRNPIEEVSNKSVNDPVMPAPFALNKTNPSSQKCIVVFSNEDGSIRLVLEAPKIASSDKLFMTPVTRAKQSQLGVPYEHDSLYLSTRNVSRLTRILRKFSNDKKKRFYESGCHPSLQLKKL